MADKRDIDLVRLAIGDTSSPYSHDDADIADILDLVRNRALTIAHFDLSDAITADEPSAPTSPELTSAPSTPSLTSAPSSPSFPTIPADLTALLGNVPSAPSLDGSPAAPSFPVAPMYTNPISLQKWQQEIAIEQAEDSTATTKWINTIQTDISLYQAEVSAWAQELQGRVQSWQMQVDNEKGDESAAMDRWLQQVRDEVSVYQEEVRVWQEQVSDLLQIYSTQNSVYSTQAAILQAKRDMLQRHAELFVDLARNGGG